MSHSIFPPLDNSEAILDTRNAMHAYARVLGDCLKASRSKRKHWWHASLRPSLKGLSTGVVRAATDFELELNFHNAALCASSSDGNAVEVDLNGQSAAEMEQVLGEFLSANGIVGVELANADRSDITWPAFSRSHAELMGQALGSISAEMEAFRAGVREETSPVQLWPHHFDLSMIWLPGEKIAGQDPNDEEYSDKQMNFGFAFGDESIPEPYFYVTAYPTPDAMAATRLPAGSEWKTDGFTGAVLTYQTLRDTSDPSAYLQDFWTRLLASGQQHMLEENTKD